MGARRSGRGRHQEETARAFFLAPRPVAGFIRAMLSTVRRRLERTSELQPTQGDALEAMLDHALAWWVQPSATLRRQHRIFERDGWLCIVPGCSSFRNLHEHHIQFRSAGGSDATSNRTTLCAWQHQRGAHAGTVRIRGQAPDGLVIELGVRRFGAPLAVYRSGDFRMGPGASRRAY